MSDQEHKPSSIKRVNGKLKEAGLVNSIQLNLQNNGKEMYKKCTARATFYTLPSRVDHSLLRLLCCLSNGQCKRQTADYCFHHANDNVTTIVPLFSNLKNNSPQSVRTSG